MAATDARPVPRKNTAYRHYLVILDADGDPVSGATGLDSEVSIDGAAFADCTNEATEIGTSGFYYLDLTAGEMNGDAICVRVQTSSSGAKTEPIILYPEEAGDIRVDVTQISGDTTAADNAELMFDGTGYAGGTAKLGVDVVAISGDTTAADNAELMFDGTGYAGGTAKLGVNVTHWLGTAAATPTTAGVPEVDITHVGGTAVTSHAGTAAAVAAGTITLAAGASAEDDVYNGWQVTVLTATTGALQTRQISNYVGATKVATLSANWDITPTGTVTYDLSPDITVASGSGLDAAGVRAAVGLASANLDTQLAAVDTEVAAILADTNELQTDWADGGRLDLLLDDAAGDEALDAAGVRATVGLASANLDTQLGDLPTAVENAAALLAATVTVGAPADGSAPNVGQALSLLMGAMGVFKLSRSGTTLTAYANDETTVLATWTLDDATTPTSRTRAS